MKTQIFIIKNGVIAFQSIFQHELYTFASAQTTCPSTFLTPIDTSPKYASTASSGDENRWPSIFFLMCGNKKKSLAAKSGLYGGWPINTTFYPVNKAVIWADVWELALSLWTMIRLLLFVFRISAKTLRKQIVHTHDQFCRRNRRPSASKWFFHRQLSLDLARVQRTTRWTVALFRAHTHRSMIRHL